jgi:hypothetical protein
MDRLDAEEEQEYVNKLTQEEIVKMMQERPFSTKAKRTIVWVDKDKESGENIQCYRMTDDDREILREYLKNDLDKFEKMVNGGSEIYPRCGWHQMYVMSVATEKGRIIRLNNDFSNFTEDAISASSHFINEGGLLFPTSYPFKN